MDSRPGDTYLVGSERFSASAVGLSRGGSRPQECCYLRSRPAAFGAAALPGATSRRAYCSPLPTHGVVSGVVEVGV